MEKDPAGAWSAVLAQPYVLAKHKDCAVCAELRVAVRPVSSRRARLDLTVVELADLLGLPLTMRIVRMSVLDDPQVLTVVVEDPGLDEVPDEKPTPPARLKLADGTEPR